MKKLLSLILAMCMILCCFTACGGNDTPDTSEAPSGGDNAIETDNTITLWAGGQWTGTDLQNLNAFVADYNKTNTLGLTVEVIEKSDMESALATAVRNNKVPDVLIWDRFNTPAYSEQNALLDISEYITRDNIDLSVFNESAMQELYYDGKYYGLPLDLDVWGVFVNMDMVDAYNAANPSTPITLNDDWTWDDMYEIAKKLTVTTNGSMSVAGYAGHVTHQHLFKYMCSQSQDFLTADGEPNFGTQQTKDILEFFSKIGGAGNGIWENGLCEKSNFTAGQLAMIDQSLYFTDYIERYSPDMNYKFMPQPRYSVNGTTPDGSVNGGMLGGFGIAFPKPHDRYVDDAFYAKFEKSWAFAKDWLLNEELQTKWSQTTGTLPALKALYTSDAITSDETLARAASFVPNYRIRPQIPAFLTLQTQVIDQQIKAYTEGKVSLEQTISNMTAGCKQYIG